MKYSETLSTINQKVNLVQKDIINNPFKYLKGNTIGYSTICDNLLSDIKRSLSGLWIEQSELEEIIKNKKIKLDIYKNKKGTIYKLTDKRGKNIIIENKIKIVYKIHDDYINMHFILGMDGDILDFNYLFCENINIIQTEIDITNIKVYISLINKIDKIKHYNFIDNSQYILFCK